MYRKMGLRMLLSAVAILTTPLWAQAQKLTIVTEEWAPYNYIENGVLKGFSVEIAQSIIKELKGNYEIQTFPGVRSKEMLDNGTRTMMFTILRTPQRETQYKWIGPLGEDAIYFYKKKGNPLNIASLDDAKKVSTIACRNAGLVPSALKAAGFTNLDTSATSGVQIYQKLLNDRCDLGISDTPLGVVYLLKQLNYPADALTQTPVKVVESRLFIAASKDIPDSEIAMWQKALDKLRANGVYDAIYKKYNE